YAKRMESGVVVCYKQREKANVIGKMELIGTVEGKDVVLVDDMIDTGGTIVKAAEMMMEKGARSVRAMITHPILSGPAHERIRNSVLEELIVTNSLPLKEENSKIKVLSCAPLFAEVMKSVHSNKSISNNFIV
ncbi:MAG: ribose-phosphate diphosphokinase, partial [Flavobacteriales bacterium]|nr:ribose-phosphate diphosphokinase [Flavobacteriales bacterium]